MSTQSKQDYLAEIRKRYLSAAKREKQRILSEFCLTCDYNRKYAIRLLHKASQVPLGPRHPGRRKKYRDAALLGFLERLWIATNLACSKRLKVMIPLWLPYYDQPLSQHTKRLLETSSHSTIDRLLAPRRSKYQKLGLATTKPGSLLKKHIPIKTNQWDESRVGFLEADTVAHCGTSTSGSFIYTVNTVDIATGWTEQRAIWCKGEQGVLQALEAIEHALPFKIHGFDCDNGNEFLNWTIFKYWTDRRRPVQFTRSREYKKNDNAHIEGKNWTHVRQYLGYERMISNTLLLNSTISIPHSGDSCSTFFSPLSNSSTNSALAQEPSKSTTLPRLLSNAYSNHRISQILSKNSSALNSQLSTLLLSNKP